MCQLLDFLVVCIDDTVVACAVLRAIAGSACRGVRIALRSRVLIQLLGDCVERLLNLVGRGLDGGNVVALLGFLQLFDGCQNS